MRCEAANADKKEVLEKEHGVLFIIILEPFGRRRRSSSKLGWQSKKGQDVGWPLRPLLGRCGLPDNEVLVRRPRLHS